MNILNLISKALENIEIPNSYMKRAKDTEECIVYNYIEIPNSYGDMKEASTKYTVLLNVYTNEDNLEDIKEKVKKAMLSAGFKKIIIPNSVIEKNGLYNTAMQFKIALLNQD